ncbi:SOS response-associated peptidase family protein [Leptospira andrefontaineae]|uniref:Abasic site processing protein n=1 Tax=Leptospira andrefontaineae TaxID=2484976 RepID=A0A4R9H733_9LEPT|nr:SOS response-associated peptidase family protein [Leptospira andrefontaineae]TGK41275.1 DUF159 family protein [Leptospira andrefontaineae]
MCGRYSLNAELSQIIEQFSLRHDLERIEREYRPEKEVFPGSTPPVIVSEEGNLTMQRLHWNYKFPKYDATPNARFEKLDIVPEWKNAIKVNRCLIPATTYWEWKRYEILNKQDRYELMFSERKLVAFAGLTLSQEKGDGQTIRKFVTITFPANKKVSEVHDRQPAIIQPINYEAWLNNDNKEVKSLLYNAIENDIEFELISSTPIRKGKPIKSVAAEERFLFE